MHHVDVPGATYWAISAIFSPSTDVAVWPTVVCSAQLDDDGWREQEGLRAYGTGQKTAASFDRFFEGQDTETRSYLGNVSQASVSQASVSQAR